MLRILLPVLLVVSQLAIAEEFTCRSGNEVRIISVEYEHKGWSVPCKVKYEKPADDLIEYPWNAAATPGYCEDRAAFLASKLEKWGWVCTQAEAASPDSE